jgi:hypothetical protein
MEQRKILTAKVAKKGRKGRKGFESIKVGHYCHCPPGCNSLHGQNAKLQTVLDELLRECYNQSASESQYGSALPVNSLF